MNAENWTVFTLLLLLRLRPVKRDQDSWKTRTKAWLPAQDGKGWQPRLYTQAKARLPTQDRKSWQPRLYTQTKAWLPTYKMNTGCPAEQAECLPLRRAMGARQYQGRSNLLSSRKRGCRQYRNGTQARSPNASMKPNPSCTMSIVVRMASWGESIRHL